MFEMKSITNQNTTTLVLLLLIGFGSIRCHGQNSQKVEIPDHIMVEEVAYSGTDEKAKTLIIAYPKEPTRPLPAIIHFHGGGFRQGKASEKTSVHFAKAGFVGISVNYRLSGEAIFPAAVHDGKTAIRWARANAATYGIDPERIGAFGGSAGGHLALMMGTSSGDTYLEGDGPYQSFSSSVQAVVENYGPTDFLKMNDVPGDMDHDSPTSPESAFIGGPIQDMKAQVKKANPITYVDPNDPPILIFHGRNDMKVPYNQSELLVDALEEVGVTFKFIPVENAGHGFNARPDEKAKIKPSREKIERMTVKWFKKHL